LHVGVRAFAQMGPDSRRNVDVPWCVKYRELYGVGERDRRRPFSSDITGGLHRDV
jgi:hypothetical protein